MGGGAWKDHDQQTGQKQTTGAKVQKLDIIVIMIASQLKLNNTILQTTIWTVSGELFQLLGDNKSNSSKYDTSDGKLCHSSSVHLENIVHT